MGFHVTQYYGVLLSTACPAIGFVFGGIFKAGSALEREMK
jgi:hypothetical protein